MTVATTVNDGGNELSWGVFDEDALNQHIMGSDSVQE